MSDTQQDLQLFAKQQKVHPKRVWGRYRILKWWGMIITLGIYYFAPFIRWDRGPNAPGQAILIDFDKYRAYWFFIEIWPQEVYYFTGILILSAFALFFVTSMFGRVWCGYFCPQTVWTDLFVWVEHIVQGDSNARIKMDKQSLSFNKIWKKTLTHIIWILISFFTAGAFVFYFNDAPGLWQDILNLSVSTAVLGFVGGLTFSTYLMAGFAREQVCTFMCPYARFQSGMFDNDTLIIGYDEKRGEKRGKHKKGDSWDGKGHCVDCSQCIQVCPTGIDIREGLQMECIACGLCVDACNNVMDKLNLKRGLIGYYTPRILQEGTHKSRPHLLRPRTFYYVIVIASVALTMLYHLVNRAALELHILHDRAPLYVQMSDGNIRNGYDIKILNKTYDDRNYTLSLSNLENATLTVNTVGDTTPEDLRATANAVVNYRVFVKAPAQQIHNTELTFTLEDNESGDIATYESLFISPEK